MTEPVVMPRTQKSPREVLIRILDAPATPASFRLTRGRCIIGSGVNCDITVTNQTVDQHHVELTLEHGLLVRDLNSLNGTRYHGHNVREIVLTSGAPITIGSVTVSIDFEPEAPEDLAFDGNEYRGIVGRSMAMRRIFAILARLEGRQLPVLIHGETGTGKELVARALHEGSRVAGPLVPFNCGAVSPTLVSSQLFGHSKGAYTGANESRMGAFAHADGGTLFLDEIGELPLEIQPMLLRVLEVGEVQPVGSDRVRMVNTRIISATHRDLQREVGEGRFRQDLFYRLASIQIHIPPLRERPEDIEPMAKFFADQAGVTLPFDVIATLQGQRWEGNARELRNAVHMYGALGRLPHSRLAWADQVSSASEATPTGTAPVQEGLRERMQRLERETILETLRAVDWNQTAGARQLGLPLRTLQYRIKILKIKRD